MRRVIGQDEAETEAPLLSLLNYRTNNARLRLRLPLLPPINAAPASVSVSVGEDEVDAESVRDADVLRLSASAGVDESGRREAAAAAAAAGQSADAGNTDLVRAPYEQYEGALYRTVAVECVASYELYDALQDAAAATSTSYPDLSLFYNFTTILMPLANCTDNTSIMWSPSNATDSDSDSGVPIHTGPTFQAWALLLFVLSLVTAFGNILVILSITREKSLQTVTNYFIISLAVADIMVGVCVMPFEIYMEMWSGVWTLQVALCDAYLATDVMSSTASILNLAAISIDRFVAVTQPIKYARQRNQPRVFGMIAISWSISIGVALPLVFGVNESPFRNPDDCQLNNSDFLIYSSLCSFYIPCIVILCLYGRIFIEIRRRSRKNDCHASNRRPHDSVDRKARKKLLKVSVESESVSVFDEPSRQSQITRNSLRRSWNKHVHAMPRISCAETEHTSADTNDTSDEQQGLACESETFRSSLSQSNDRHNTSDCPRLMANEKTGCVRDYSVSELSFSSSFQRSSSMRMHVSHTTSFELYENAFTDMDYVDEIDSPPLTINNGSNGRALYLRNQLADRSSPGVLENWGATWAQRSPEITMHTIKEESNGGLNTPSVGGTVTANHHAIVSFDRNSATPNGTATDTVAPPTPTPTPASAPAPAPVAAAAPKQTAVQTSTNVVVNNTRHGTNNRLLSATYSSTVVQDSDEEKQSPRASPSCKAEHNSRLFRLTQRKSEFRRDRTISRERKVTKVMIIVLACFLACWMPFFSLNMVNAFCLKYGFTASVCQIERQLFIALTWLGYINSSLNPLIYCWQNREFRRAFHAILTCAGPSSSGRRRT